MYENFLEDLFSFFYLDFLKIFFSDKFFCGAQILLCPKMHFLPPPEAAKIFFRVVETRKKILEFSFFLVYIFYSVKIQFFLIFRPDKAPLQMAIFNGNFFPSHAPLVIPQPRRLRLLGEKKTLISLRLCGIDFFS